MNRGIKRYIGVYKGIEGLRFRVYGLGFRNLSIVTIVGIQKW